MVNRFYIIGMKILKKDMVCPKCKSPFSKIDLIKSPCDAWFKDIKKPLSRYRFTCYGCCRLFITIPTYRNSLSDAYQYLKSETTIIEDSEIPKGGGYFESPSLIGPCDENDDMEPFYDPEEVKHYLNWLERLKVIRTRKNAL